MPSPFTTCSHAVSIKAFRRRTRSDHVTRNALAGRNNEAYGQVNGRQSFCTVLRYQLKHWKPEFLLLAVFTLELEMDYPSETGLCTVAPPQQTPFL